MWSGKIVLWSKCFNTSTMWCCHDVVMLPLESENDENMMFCLCMVSKLRCWLYNVQKCYLDHDLVTFEHLRACFARCYCWSCLISVVHHSHLTRWQDDSESRISSDARTLTILNTLQWQVWDHCILWFLIFYYTSLFDCWIRCFWSCTLLLTGGK